MKRRILQSVILTFCFSLTVFAQGKPAWISSVEENIIQKEKLWKIENKIEREENGSYTYSFTLKSGEYRSNIQIDKIDKIPNAEETFEGMVISFDNTMGKNKKKSELENFGDEGFIWTINKDGWTAIMFRKSDIFVNIYAPSEKTAKRFAQYVLDKIS